MDRGAEAGTIEGIRYFGIQRYPCPASSRLSESHGTHQVMGERAPQTAADRARARWR